MSEIASHRDERLVERLLAAACRGDRRAGAALIQHYSGFVLERARRQVRSSLQHRCEPSDIAQSVLTDALEAVHRLDNRGRRSFEGWLGKITCNTVAMSLRRHTGSDVTCRVVSVSSANDLPDPLETPIQSALRRERYAHARALLLSLGPQEREVVRLRIEEDLSHREVAIRLGLLSEDAARKRYMRAIKHLRRRARTG